MDAFDVYRKCVAIKLHFTSPSYDYFKYHGSIKQGRDTFETRNDKYFYHKLSKKDYDIDLFLACNYFAEPKIWVGQILDERYINRYLETKKVMQSLDYIFKSEMSQFDSLDHALNVRNGEYPNAYMKYRSGELSKETLIILNTCLGVFDYWSNGIDDMILWPTERDNLLKYAPFMGTINKTHWNEIMLDIY